MLSVAIVEDNVTIRSGLKELINTVEHFTCAAEFSSCEEILAELTHLSVDIILMDVNLPGISGIEGIREIKKVKENQKIIILTIHSESENLFEALAVGAYGYLEKKSPSYQIEKIIEDVYNHKSNMNTFIARKVISYFSNEPSLEKLDGKILNSREHEILKSLIDGQSPKAIANSIKVSSESIYSSFYSIYEKLHNCYKFEKV